MDSGLLHVFTARFNPLRWQAPHRHYLDWVEHMLDSGAELHVAELQYGERPFACAVSAHPRFHHYGFRADSWCWSKENLLNLGIARAPSARYICWSDSDVWFRKPGWAGEIVEHLQHYRIVQPWADCYDLGPHDEHLAHHVSFCRQWLHGHPVHHTWNPHYAFPHPGFVWATRRDVLDWTGGLFELAGMGSADHHQAYAILGRVSDSIPPGAAASYGNALVRWQDRAVRAINGRIGYVPGTIEHRFHGAKPNRGYETRWGSFVKHGFDPDADLKRNTHGVLEFAGNKPELEREWDLYLRARREDDNTAGGDPR